MKKLKLVPEGEYNKYHQDPSSEYITDTSNVQRLIHKKRDILTAEDIPDDIKSIIYQDLSRRLHQRKRKELQKPVLVKDISKSEAKEEKSDTEKKPKIEEPSEIDQSQSESVEQDTFQKLSEQYIISQINSKSAKKVLDFMKENGITWNRNLEVVIGESYIPESNIVSILSTLVGKSVEKSIGFEDVYNTLNSSDLSRTKKVQEVLDAHKFSPPKLRTRLPSGPTPAQKQRSNWSFY
jgi:CRISPR/Cas system-associated endonuclease/helicase Cas3